MRTRVTRLSATKDVPLFKDLDMHSGITQGILISPEVNISALESKCKVNLTISYTSKDKPLEYRWLMKVTTNGLENYHNQCGSKYLPK